ncbi:MAG TPA: hypothetical protein VH475_20140 [Tepidisphaeraceae bacterium]|jgi:hypothetical protein
MDSEIGSRHPTWGLAARLTRAHEDYLDWVENYEKAARRLLGEPLDVLVALSAATALAVIAISLWEALRLSS